MCDLIPEEKRASTKALRAYADGLDNFALAMAQGAIPGKRQPTTQELNDAIRKLHDEANLCRRVAMKIRESA